MEVLCTIFCCLLEDLNETIWLNYDFADRLLQNLFFCEGLAINEIPGYQYRGLFWATGETEDPSLPMVTLRHFTTTGREHVSVVFMEFFRFSKLARC